MVVHGKRGKVTQSFKREEKSKRSSATPKLFCSNPCFSVPTSVLFASNYSRTNKRKIRSKAESKSRSVRELGENHKVNTTRAQTQSVAQTASFFGRCCKVERIESSRDLFPLTSILDPLITPSLPLALRHLSVAEPSPFLI